MVVIPFRMVRPAQNLGVNLVSTLRPQTSFSGYFYQADIHPDERLRVLYSRNWVGDSTCCMPLFSAPSLLNQPNLDAVGHAK